MKPSRRLAVALLAVVELAAAAPSRGKLYAARDLEPTQPLEPVQGNAYTLGSRNVTFERNAGGDVTAITFSASGVDALLVPKVP